MKTSGLVEVGRRCSSERGISRGRGGRVREAPADLVKSAEDNRNEEARAFLNRTRPVFINVLGCSAQQHERIDVQRVIVCMFCPLQQTLQQRLLQNISIGLVFLNYGFEYLYLSVNYIAGIIKFIS